MNEPKPADTLVEAMIKAEAIASPSLIDDGHGGKTIPKEGKIFFYKPLKGTGAQSYIGDSGLSEDDFYAMDAKYLWDLNWDLKASGFRKFDYIAHGQHAIIFNVHDEQYDQKKKVPAYLDPRKAANPYLRIHFGPPQPRTSPDAFRAINVYVPNDKITCEEIEYFNVAGRENLDPKVLLGVGISSLSNGYFFNDPHGGNVAMRTGDTRFGILEPHAVNQLADNDRDHLDTYAVRFIEEINKQRRNQDSLKEKYKDIRKNAAADPDKRRLAMLDDMTHPYGQGDVIETLSNSVILLNGDHYHNSPVPGYSAKHPALEERRQLVKNILRDEKCDDYKEINGEFIVIHQPNPYPPDRDKSERNAKLAEKLREALDKHEKDRLAKAEGHGPASPHIARHRKRTQIAPPDTFEQR